MHQCMKQGKTTAGEGGDNGGEDAGQRRERGGESRPGRDRHPPLCSGELRGSSGTAEAARQQLRPPGGALCVWGVRERVMAGCGGTGAG